MNKLMLLTVCGLIVVLHAADEPKPVPPAPPDADVEASYQRGLKYLLTHQNPDGTWGSFESARPDEIYLGTVASFKAFGDGASALAMMALLSPSKTDPEAAKALDKAIQYFIKTPVAVRPTADVMYNVWTHIYILEAISEIMLDERFLSLKPELEKVAEKNIEGLRRIQGAEGGFGYYDFHFAASTPTGDESTSFTTAAGLLALDRAKTAGMTIPELMQDRAVKSLNRLRGPDGAFIYGVYIRNAPQRLANRTNGSLGRSQSCNLALWKYHSGMSQDQMRQGLQNLFDNHLFIEIGKGRPVPHEAWYQTAGYYFMFGHYYGARVANELPPDDRKKFLGGLGSVLTRLQDADGSWWDFPMYNYHKAYGTAFGLMTLDALRKSKKESK